MSPTVMALVLRHLLTAIAGGAFVEYQLDEDTATAIVGGLSALAGVLWSIYEKKRKK